MTGGFYVFSHCDITEQTDVDAIVNAANKWLMGGGGVDGAIHKAAGPLLMQECDKITSDRNGVRCPPGEVRVTQPGRLPIKAIIHAVGPNCQTGYRPRVHDAILASAWRKALEAVASSGFSSVAFPSISTGIYAFPIERAAAIVGEVAAAFLKEHPDVHIRLCLMGGSSEAKKRLYEAAFARAARNQDSASTTGHLR